MSLLLSLALHVGAPALESELYRAQMAAAESAMRLGEYAEARAWLAATPSTLRGFEWHADRALLDESLAELSSDEAYVAVLALSPDGRLLALGDGRRVVAASRDRTARGLDADTSERIVTGS